MKIAPSFSNKVQLRGPSAGQSISGELVFDLDKDGKISTREQELSRQLCRNRNYLNSLDVNHDGVVDARELKKAGAKVRVTEWGCLGRRQVDYEVDNIRSNSGRVGVPQNSGHSVLDGIDLKSGGVRSHWSSGSGFPHDHFRHFPAWRPFAL